MSVDKASVVWRASINETLVTFGRLLQKSLHVGRELIRAGQQLADLPNLLVRKIVLVRRHTRQANSVRDLPICLTRWIVCHSFALQKLRRLGEHAFRGSSLAAGHDTMAHRTVFPIQMRRVLKVGIGRLKWNRFWSLLIDASIQRRMG